MLGDQRVRDAEQLPVIDDSGLDEAFARRIRFLPVCYCARAASMTATDFGLNGLPRSLRWPCSASDAEIARRLNAPPFGFLRRAALPAPQRPGASRRGSCALDLLASRHALAPPQAWPQGSSSRTQRPRPTADAPARRSVCPRQSGWATGGAAMPPHGVAVQVAGVWAGRQGLSGRRSGVGQFGSRRNRLSPRAPGGVFGSGGSGVSFGSASNFTSAARGGSRRGARRNRSSSMARRIAAVTAAYSSSVRSIVGMA
jgi:hypothetical protein